MNETLTYPYLKIFYDKAKDRMQPAIYEWVRSQARASAGGLAYPENAPLRDEDPVQEGVDAALYKRVYNACVQWAGRDLAANVAGKVAAVESVRATDELAYRQEPVTEDTVTEVDIEGLEDEVAARFLLSWARPERIHEIYGGNLEKGPDYVPKGKRRAWASLWDAIYREGGGSGNSEAEAKAFRISNAKYVTKNTN